MKKAGQIVLFQFPQTDLEKGKLRPALLLGKLPGEYNDWLICMISSQTRQYIAGFDEIVKDGDKDFEQSGLKVTSVIRVGRLAVVSGEMCARKGCQGEKTSGRIVRAQPNQTTRGSKWNITLKR
jgi:mRNA interferase MazF